METIQPQHDLYHEPPDNLLLNGFTHLRLNILTQVPLRTMFHHYKQLRRLNKRVNILDDIRRVNLLHEFGLIHGPLSKTGVQSTELDLFYHVEVLGVFVLDPVDNAEGACAEFGQELVVFEWHEGYRL